MVPESSHKYLPDFILSNGIYIEAKGLFNRADRQKHILIRKQYPEIDLRFVFQNMKNKISKQSKTTYADWCVKNGFKFANQRIPVAWIQENHTYNRSNL